MSKKKVKEIKSKIKIIREIKNDSGGFESKETELFENGMVEGSGVENVISLGGGARVVELPREQPGSVREERIREQATTGPLYDIGKTLGGSASSGAERAYKTAEALQENNTRWQNVGRNFAMSSGGLSHPEDQAHQIENKMRETGDSDRKYDDGMKGGSQKNKRGHGYAWET